MSWWLSACINNSVPVTTVDAIDDVEVDGGWGGGGDWPGDDETGTDVNLKTFLRFV